ncbi:MAG: DNA replication/repair protein RecF [Bacteroidia bacterium]
MQNLLRLQLQHFRSHRHVYVTFTHPTVAFVGPNGIGKTHFLEAIQVISLLRGFTSWNHICQKGESFFRIRALLHPEDLVEITYTLGKSLTLHYNQTPITPLSQWIGKYPVISLRPQEILWVEGEADLRRQWIDRILAQAYAPYLHALSRYTKAVENYNRLLKAAASLHEKAPWEKILTQTGILVQTYRAQALRHLSDLISQTYSFFADKETVTLRYHFSVPPEEESWHKAWEKNRKVLQEKQVLFWGPHRDSLEISLGGLAARHTASQGQKKSLLIALKVAEFYFLNQKTQKSPWILLDDIFEKLDPGRLSQLKSLLATLPQTHIFLTDSDPKRVADYFPEAQQIYLPLPHGMEN